MLCIYAIPGEGGGCDRGGGCGGDREGRVVSRDRSVSYNTYLIICHVILLQSVKI